MAKPELIIAINNLSQKVDYLLERLKETQDKVVELEKEAEILRARHQEDTRALQIARKDIEFLTLSHRLADSPEALNSARNKISQLIKTIDSCIRMIKED